MRVLLSIKPEYARKIFDGTKKFEFRKSLFKKPGVTTVVVYASSPVQKVIGEFEIDKIMSGDPVSLWNETKCHAGISEDFFFEYFEGRDSAFAIKIKQVKSYSTPLCLKKSFKTSPPQSFAYLT